MSEEMGMVTVKSLVESPAYKARFAEILKERAPQFTSALVTLSASKQIAECNPKSVIAAAFQAATLDLPIEKNLGIAHIVPYKGVAQFQIGYKGYIQLAMRSGMYKRIVDSVVNAEAYLGVDEFGEVRIDFSKIDETKPAVGFLFAWELTSGFKKVCYWSIEKVKAHAERYSQAYRYALKNDQKDSPWINNFNAMSLKTVISNSLKKYGILSVQMQKALAVDQTVQEDVGVEPAYIDVEDGSAEEVKTEEPKTSATEKLADKLKKGSISVDTTNA